MSKTIFNRDKFMTMPARPVCNAAMALVDRIQYEPNKEVAMMAAACLFINLAEHWNMPAQDAFTAANNMMNHVVNKRAEFAAVRQYIQEEL